MIVIIDNFLDNPYSLVAEAKKNIKINLYKTTQRNYPGIKVAADLTTKKLIENKINKIIKDNLSCTELQYQFIDKSFLSGCPHEDLPKQYTSILFLHQNPIKNSGIELYKKYNEFPNTSIINIEFLNKLIKEKEKFIASPTKNFFERRKYLKTIKIVKKELHKYCSPLIVENKFNRIVIFNSSIIHCSQNYFGIGENSRLNLVGFF